MRIISNKYLKFTKANLPQEPNFQSKNSIKVWSAHGVCATGL